jgi:fucose permease
VVFRFQGQDGTSLSPFGTDTDRALIITDCLREVGEVIPDKAAEDVAEKGKFSQMMSYKAVHLLSLFLLIYVGAEVTIGGTISSLCLIAQQKSDYCKSGWTASYLIIVRGGGPSSGYVSTGFFGGKLSSNSLRCVDHTFNQV